MIEFMRKNSATICLFFIHEKRKNKKMSLETKHGTKKVEQIREQQSYSNFNEKTDFKKSYL